MKIIAFLFINIVFTLVICAGQHKFSKNIQTSFGKIRGYESKLSSGKRICVFKGIPYATPPVKHLRWKAPQKHNGWSGVRDCVEFSSVCPQPKQTKFLNEISNVDEDCLYLNIWTPANAKKLPVMLWIHGGGFTMGAGSLSIYDGTNLAAKDVVLVSINYRLGAFGFFAHPALSAESPEGISGNYGLLDQVEALKWVKENISAFGGDPGNITIFGESAGAVSVACLMVSPLAKGLFHRAISESGFAIGLGPMRRGKNDMQKYSERRLPAEEKGLAMAAILECTGSSPETLKKLRSKSADEILMESRLSKSLFGKGFKLQPCIDGVIIPEDPLKAFQLSNQHKVPYMIGINANEGTVFQKGSLKKIKTPAAFRKFVKSFYPGESERILKLYPAKSPKKIPKAMEKLITDSIFLAPAKFAACCAVKSGMKVFFYYFNRKPGWTRTMGLGAFHGLEILYIFGNSGKINWFNDLDKRLSEAMSTYWVNFAKTGNPNCDKLPTWRPYDPKKDNYLEINNKIMGKNKLRQNKCDFFMKKLL